MVHTPTEAFTETEMLLQWTKYAQKLGSKGYRIMESLLLINDPKLDGTRITIELPNEGSKLDFESQKTRTFRTPERAFAQSRNHY